MLWVAHQCFCLNLSESAVRVCRALERARLQGGLGLKLTSCVFLALPLSEPQLTHL